VVADYADEYRGVVEGGHASHWIGGPVEQGWSRSEWTAFLDENPRVVLARHDALAAEDWQQLVASVARSIRRRSGSVLFVVDEAHFVVPQRGSYGRTYGDGDHGPRRAGVVCRGDTAPQ
jgi:hypothetical protein